MNPQQARPTLAAGRQQPFNAGELEPVKMRAGPRGDPPCPLAWGAMGLPARRGVVVTLFRHEFGLMGDLGFKGGLGSKGGFKGPSRVWPFKGFSRSKVWPLGQTHTGQGGSCDCAGYLTSWST